MRLGALVLVFLSLAGCHSGTSQRPQASGSAPTVAGSSPTAPSGSATPGSSGSPSHRSTAKATPKKSASPTFGPSSARLDKSCVRRGAQDDRQGITIKTDPGGPASYQTVYSDGSTIIERPHEYSSGGQNGGFADSSGTYRDTWVVPPAAPLGRATVRAVVAGRSDTINLYFTIVGASDSCP